jgi:hypothetical protein
MQKHFASDTSQFGCVVLRYLHARLQLYDRQNRKQIVAHQAEKEAGLWSVTSSQTIKSRKKGFKYRVH